MYLLRSSYDRTEPLPPTHDYGPASRADSNLRTTFLSLRNRNFRLFFIGHLISNTGNWLTNVADATGVLRS